MSRYSPAGYLVSTRHGAAEKGVALFSRILQALLRLNKNNASFWNTLAVVYHSRRNMAMAERCAREVFAL